MNLDKILNDSIEIVKKVGGYIKNEMPNLSNEIVETKSLHNFVTYVDKQAEKQLVTELSKLISEAGFVTEEETIEQAKNKKYKWIIDPLDGTTNFIHKLFPVAISVALQENEKTILGIIYEIGLDECFYSHINTSAYMNGKQISVSKTKKVSDSLIATGFPYYNYKKLPEFMKTIEFFMQKSHGLRRPGSAATDLAYVACGRFDGFYEYSLKVWDVAAGAFLVEQAGGKVCDFSGKNNYLYGQEIIASNNYIFSEFFDSINSIICK
jgi:myo-inositol-1(or 4)-monophosphatase